MSDTLKAEISQLEDQRYAAMIAKDMPALDRLFADALVYTHSTCLVDDKASYMEGIRTGKFDYRKAERFDVSMSVHNGDTVIVTGRAHLDILASGTPKTLRNRFTNVWVKGPKGWQMAVWQSTPLPA